MSTAIAKSDPRDISFGESCHLTAVGIRFDQSPSFDVWSAAASFVERVGRANQWWFADLLLAANENDERYEQGIALLGLDYQTLRNYVWVARQYPLSCRKDTLSFTHHAVAAALEEPTRSELLDEAIAQGWSVSRLRKQVRSYASNGHRLPELPLPAGKYRCVVLKPPWPMDATSGMSIAELRPKLIEQLRAVAADECHLYLTTPQRHLSVAIALADACGFSYSHLLTVATPCDASRFSWASDVELVVFAVRGRLELIALGQKTAFSNSAELFDRIQAASPGPRLSMFDDVPEREGFETWCPNAAEGEPADENLRTIVRILPANELQDLPPLAEHEPLEPASTEIAQPAGDCDTKGIVTPESLERLAAVIAVLDEFRERLTGADDVQPLASGDEPALGSLRGELCGLELLAERSRAITSLASAVELCASYRSGQILNALKVAGIDAEQAVAAGSKGDKVPSAHALGFTELAKKVNQ